MLYTANLYSDVCQLHINKQRKNIYTWFLSLKKSSGGGLFVSTLPPSLIFPPHTSQGETVLRSHIPALPGSPGQAAGRSGEPHKSGGCDVPMQSLPFSPRPLSTWLLPKRPLLLGMSCGDWNWILSDTKRNQLCFNLDNPQRDWQQWVNTFKSSSSLLLRFSILNCSQKPYFFPPSLYKNITSSIDPFFPET